jgi:hypothetical protein
MIILKTTLTVAVLAILTQAAYGDCSCPSCGEKVCRVEAKTKTVKKHCYKVECKEICIPKLKFCWPWQKGAKASCGSASGECTSDCTSSSACTDPGCADGNCKSCSTCQDAARCGKVKTVRVLKKVDYECKECGYEWKTYDVGCASAGCADAGCAAPSRGPVKVYEGSRHTPCAVRSFR